MKNEMNSSILRQFETSFLGLWYSEAKVILNVFIMSCDMSTGLSKAKK